MRTDEITRNRFVLNCNVSLEIIHSRLLTKHIKFVGYRKIFEGIEKGFQGLSKADCRGSRSDSRGPANHRLVRNM